MRAADSFWSQSCGARGPALIHTHGACEDPDRRNHDRCACEDCGLTPERWAALVSNELREAGIPPEASHAVDPDSLPLTLAQPTDGNCNSPLHKAIWSSADGWLACPVCNVRVEPKLATGQLSGPMWGTGRGWVNPRTRKRWEAIAHRAYDRAGGEYAAR